MKFLVVGCGTIGKRHMRNLNALNAGELIAYRTGKEGSAEIEKEFGAKIFYDYNKALKEKPDAVLITNPTSLHVPAALKAAKSGAHLFIEKPISHNMKDVDKLIGIVREKKLVTLIGYDLRFSPSIKKIKELLEKNAIGKLISARIQVGGFMPRWRQGKDYRKIYSSRKELGGGVILDLSHEIDYARWFFGDVKEVFCYAEKLSNLEINVEDTAEMLLKFKSGVLGEVHMDYIQKVTNRAAHIIGEDGLILWDTYQKKVRLYKENEQKWADFPEPENFASAIAQTEEMQHFINCIEGKEKPIVDIVDAKKTLEVALAAKKSAQTGKIVKIGGKK